MTEIPKDIDKIASDIVRTDFTKFGDEFDYLLFGAIAAAILAERERCAETLRKLYFRRNGEEIAEVILKGAEV